MGFDYVYSRGEDVVVIDTLAADQQLDGLADAAAGTRRYIERMIENMRTHARAERRGLGGSYAADRSAAVLRDSPVCLIVIVESQRHRRHHDTGGTGGRVKLPTCARLYDVAVKKLPEIGDAFLELEWEEKDQATVDYRFLKGLHEEGYHPIQVGRSTFVIEQCERGDPVPNLVATDALRITIHGDKDLDSSETTYYIWGGRYGIASGGIYESDGTQIRPTPFDRNELVMPRTVLPAVRMLLDGARNKVDHLPCGPDGNFVDDDHYRALRQDVINALEAFERYVGVRYRR